MSDLGGKYQLGERIGGGGMADVFRATTHGAEGFSRPVAIKQIKKSISDTKGFADLFIAEARIAAQLIHPNVVQTIDFDRDVHGHLYIVMELIEGIDLRHLIQSGRIPVAACMYIATEILRALDYAHELVDAGGHRVTIIHRDVSPHNIMLGWQGLVKVVDFGIAKIVERSLVSRSGSLKGKVAYMSPEQVHGHNLDGRSDLFAVGIILHEILTGKRLFVAQTEAATLSRLLTQPIPLPSAANDQVPAALDKIVMQLLERDREDRYVRAKDAMDALLDCPMINKGRSQLETVLSERFSDRIPQRVARLSSSSSGSDRSGRYEVLHRDSDRDAIASAETIAATPTSRAADAPIVDVQEPPDTRNPKRTYTAQPAMATRPEESHSTRSKTSGNPWPIRIGVAISMIAIAAIVLLTLIDPSDDSPSQSDPVKVVHVVSPDAKVVSSPLPAEDIPIENIPIEDVAERELVNDASAIPSIPLDAGIPASKVALDDNKRSNSAATLTLRVLPWASIVIDGRSYGQTPQTIKLPHGKHRITLENSGLNRKERFTLVLKPSQRKLLSKDWR